VLLDAIDLVRLGDVQLVAFRDLQEVRALVECTAEAGLPHGGVGLVPSLPVFAFVLSPGLNVRTHEKNNQNIQSFIRKDCESFAGS